MAQKRDQSLVARFDNLSRGEKKTITNKIIDLKEKVAPKSRGTIIRSNGANHALGGSRKQQLPSGTNKSKPTKVNNKKKKI